ncbi:MAG: fibronectin type III domain-containing protein [Verrucomicrobiaceae bacterium]|nr:fibronectin type III domain-containing protein [Verrucomicrobiaceae bacterium]
MNRFLPLLLSTLVVISGALAHAVELIGQPQVVTTATGATISWKTDVECGTRLQYGLSAAQLNQKAEGPVAAEHQITLSGLSTGTTYHFSVGSARTRLATGSFVTSGSAPAATPQPSIVRRVLDVLTPDKKPAPAAVPPTRMTWANVATLQDHFDRHGRDFSSKSPDDYAAQAWQFLQRARAESLPMKLDDTDGTLRVFDPKTRAFAAYNNAGLTKTFFKPESPSYWQRQPGRAVKPSSLRFSSR